MNIIIEGTDATGKSTLAKKLQENFNLTYQHSSSETDNDFDYHFELLDSKENVVLDRFQLGEIIYPIFTPDRESKITLSQAVMLSRMEDTITIILYASDTSILKERLHERGETFSNLNESANSLFKLLGEMFELLEVPVLLLDVCEFKDEELFEEVNKYVHFKFNK